MSAFMKEMARDRRLCILRLLNECGGSTNEGVLHNGLDMLGHRRLARETVREDLRFLIDLMLLSEEWFEDVLVVTITRRGVEVAEGRLQVEGVKVPRVGK